MKDKYLTLYRVAWCDEEETRYECGIFYAENYSDAAKRIEEYYADNLIEITYLCQYDTTMFHMPADMFEKLKQYIEKEF